MAPKSAARTNLTSNSVAISKHQLGEGSFRICYMGTYRGGNRNQQEAACKKFKSQFIMMEEEYFRADFDIADKAIEYAEEWNRFCMERREITVSRGSVHVDYNTGRKFLVEPYIRDFRKFTSNSGWIAPGQNWDILAMEAFSHYTYHRSGGRLIVCDLQGRYRKDRFGRGDRNKSRFELSDPAICSRARSYGPTDLGEKGIDSFFANHVCNQFCHADGMRWQRPRNPHNWFQSSSGTSMFSSLMDSKLKLTSRATFSLGFGNIMEEGEDDDSLESYDSYEGY